MTSDLQLSKRLSWLLRHGAAREGLPIRPDGFVVVDTILKHPKYGHDLSLERLKEIVSKDKKQRYTLRQNQCGAYEIRANQGHSIVEVEDSHCLHRIHKADEVKLAVHGTYYRHWPRIIEEGLRPMGRLHVHFAMFDDIAKTAYQSSPQSGFRSDCELLVYLDVQKAMEIGGMEIYRSSNNVILCAGSNGHIPKEYFRQVVDRRTGKELQF
ncbi:putative tRNA 2'-phosphotransferase [Rhagoletis pomonella]|uniref:putative tRNA 2'-phosphotransferase n=1 Tax=Rhagoletis pomonella TaxID=28610 RepID=UPI00177F69EC|nr:putative tRNA 2'-phosphotransferase [Rhagoletis pomonella]